MRGAQPRLPEGMLTVLVAACAVGASHILRAFGLAEYQGLWIGAALLTCGLRGLRRSLGYAYLAGHGDLAALPTDRISGLGAGKTDNLLVWLCGAPAALRGMALRSAKEASIGIVVTLPWLFPAEVYWRVGHGAAGVRWDALGFDLNTLASEAIVTVLPEEVFFRGWLLSTLLLRMCRSGGASLPDAERPPSQSMSRGRLMVCILAQSVIFALFHVLTLPHPARLAVFFPGLLFGALSLWRGGIGAACASHLLCNLYVRQLGF